MSKQKNKVFYVITSLDYGGTQQQLYYLLKNFHYSDYLPVVVSLKKGGRFLSKVKKVCQHIYDLNLPLKVSTITYLLYPVAFVKFLLLCLIFKPKIIHSFLFQANFVAKLTKIFFWKTRIICSERVAEKQKLWQHKISRLTNFLVDKIIVNSEDLRKFVIKCQKVTSHKVIVIPNMIDLQEIKIKCSSEELRSKLNLSKDTFVICSVGRLHKQKGYDLLLEVVKGMVSDCDILGIPKNFVVIILGDGEEYLNLISYAEKLGVNNYVKFLGYQEDVYDFINMCDLFVLSSYWEGSANVILEALVLKKPVVSTAVEGVNEVLDSKYVVPLLNERYKIVEIFKQKILQMYKEHLEHRFVYLTKNFDVQIYSPEFVIKKYLTLYC